MKCSTYLKGFLGRLIKSMHLKVFWKLSSTIDTLSYLSEAARCHGESLGFEVSQPDSNSGHTASWLCNLWQFLLPLWVSVFFSIEMEIVIPAPLLLQVWHHKCSIQDMFILKIFYLSEIQI